MNKAVFVIVGAGQAGAVAAAELRRNGFNGRVVLIGDEPHAPYERPPLSKELLLHPETARCQLFPDDFYAEHNIEVRLGTRVTAIDPAARHVSLNNGETLPFDRLLLATGATVRRLPLLDQLGEDIYTLRTLDDARVLQSVIKRGRRIVLVGGGVVGLELASSAIDLGAHVTIVEQAPMVMGRCSPAILNEYLCKVHSERGAVLHIGTAVTHACRDNGEIALTLADGTRVTGDAIVYGIGVEPDTSLASAAGLEVDNGILVDERARTSHPAIYAAGDAAKQWDPHTGHYRRLETWENANRQAVAAAKSMMDIDADKVGAPWFWTDQCGLNIQFAGDMTGAQWIVRGTMGEPGFMLLGVCDDRLVAAVMVNRPRDMRSARMLIDKQVRLAPESWRDSQQSLRSLLNGG
ncbi:FAD-dependent oxidoreductase [Paraburkholderia sp. MMS20-SJTR3]|uniref:FAD-dependent oxidoreductase n=1 Tax=Paraburkholderia sejongensis TaxID=2886946 RepID=A0ABS8K5I6_9BURK|nr:3-phenylpropionate/cinnamic acid dioxygenase ferredoxin--NAD(+) reductase subunit [Paraburkholderia sp. MMS20-SJTR3]MCC8397368.1 FAD-dependent oxidoreductase [Paraburkholderia sp. MMS20-SJTR3]